MTDQHRATPEQWALVASEAADGSATHSCMLELNDTLRALCIARNDLVVCSTEQNQRIEALEAAPAFRVLETGERIQMNIVQDKLDRLIALDAADPTPDPAITVLRAAGAEAQPGGLVERVANAISEGDEPDKWHPEARDAICEVATWLDRFALHGSGEYAQAAKVLRQEANHG